MRRVFDNCVIKCPLCNNIMKEGNYEEILTRSNGKRLIQFELYCPNSGCETTLTHTTFDSYERGYKGGEERMEEGIEEEERNVSDLSFEDQMALDETV